MAKKISGAKTSDEAGTDRRAVPAGASPLLASGISEPPAKGREARAGTAQRTVPAKLKPSALLDTRVVYCGDNLEQLAKLPDDCRKPMQNEEGRMMKLARFQILHSSFILLNLAVTGSFYYHCGWHANARSILSIGVGKELA